MKTAVHVGSLNTFNVGFQVDQLLGCLKSGPGVEGEEHFDLFCVFLI